MATLVGEKKWVYTFFCEVHSPESHLTHDHWTAWWHLTGTLKVSNTSVTMQDNLFPAVRQDIQSQRASSCSVVLAGQA